MKREEVTKKIVEAYNRLISKDRGILEVDANERSITHKLAEYLQIEFPDWNVDCEYNRNGVDPKKLDTFAKHVNSDDTNAVSVYPDIIIHHRRTTENLAVIEAKKGNSRVEDLDDAKLCAYKDELRYQFAYKVTFSIGDLPENIDVSAYIKGDTV